MLDFLRSTGVGRTVPGEDGENEEEDQDGASESSGRRIRKLCDVLSALLSALLTVLLCVYGLADSGERRKPRRTGHFVSGGVRTRSVYLNCHGRARPNTE